MDDLARGGRESPVGGPQRPHRPVSLLTALGRGLMKRTEGDTWAFTIIGDRIPVAAGIVVVYFGLGSRLGPVALIVVMAVLCALLLLTAPNRWGLGVALLYLQRTWWPDPLDKLPKLSTTEDTE